MGYISDSKSFKQFMDMKIDTELKQYDDYFVKDEVTKNVMLDLAERSRKGYKKYSTTLHENNHQNMLQHAYEEVLDLAQYLKKEMSTLSTVQDLAKQYSNDQELGKAIRAKYGKK